MNSIKFQNFQKLFIESDMTWRNKGNEFIYIIRTQNSNRERDQIEQVTAKNFNRNTYFDKVDKENTFWLLQGGNIYRSVNWVYCYYTSFDHSVSLNDKIPYYSEQIRRRDFKQEKRKERKLVYKVWLFQNTNTRRKKGCGSGYKR